MANGHRSRKGTSLVEVMVAMVVFAVVVLGGSFLFVYSRARIGLQDSYRTAAHLAAQKMEELKAGDYDDIEQGATQEEVEVEDMTYDRKVATVLLPLYKRVDVTISWNEMDKNCDVSLVTFISP